MAAPEHVPVDRTQPVRGYSSSPLRSAPWLRVRPGEVIGVGQPTGAHFGSQGPDQGYALLLAERFRDRLSLTPGEHEGDALAGAVGVALKRASLFGRAPVIHDLTVALTIWGFLGPAPDELVALRTRLFEEVSNPHHYAEARRIVDLVPESALRLTPEQAVEAQAADWWSLIDVPAAQSAS